MKGWRHLSEYCVEDRSGNWRITKMLIDFPAVENNARYLVWHLQGAQWILTGKCCNNAADAVSVVKGEAAP